MAPLVDVPVAELALQIYLQAAYSASEVAHLEMIAYEFMEQVQPPSPVLNPLSPSIYLTLVLQVPLLQLSAPQFGFLVCLSHAALLCLDSSERSTCMFSQNLKDLVEFVQCKPLSIFQTCVLQSFVHLLSTGYTSRHSDLALVLTDLYFTLICRTCTICDESTGHREMHWALLMLSMTQILSWTASYECCLQCRCQRQQDVLQSTTAAGIVLHWQAFISYSMPAQTAKLCACAVAKQCGQSHERPNMLKPNKLLQAGREETHDFGECRLSYCMRRPYQTAKQR